MNFNDDNMKHYVGPIACYRKHKTMFIWENQAQDPIFADEAVFVNIQKNNSSLIDWIGGRFAVE